MREPQPRHCWSVWPVESSTRRCGQFRHLADRARVTLELYRKRTGATVSVSLDLRSSLSIQPFEGSRFVRGGRYGISIDFGLEVVEKQSACSTIFESECTCGPDLFLQKSLLTFLNIVISSLIEASMDSASVSDNVPAEDQDPV